MSLFQKNGRIKFIVPDWDDIVDPGFNFETETFSEEYKRNRYLYGARIWHLFDDDVIDGVLVSRSMIERKGRAFTETKIRNFLRLLPKLEVIADCGAWQYIDQEYPPYDAIETLDFYQHIGADFGVSVDHIVFGGNPEKRMQTTYENAVKSLEVWSKRFEKGDYTFILLTAVQGVEIDHYISMMEKLYNRGSRYFAIGGLAKRSTEFIKRLLSSLANALRNLKDVERIHFLGVVRPQVVRFFYDLLDYVKEVSFDNATFLRMAWMRPYGNYITLNGSAYTAIRVRKGTPGENEVLQVLRKYDRGELNLDEVYKVLREYTARINEMQYLPYYLKTLEDKPWKKCPCPICRSIGIDVVIFRGNDRNRRRGFHNLYVFYNLLKQGADIRFRIAKKDDPTIGGSSESEVNHLLRQLLERGLNRENIRRILVVTHCTAEKRVNMQEVLQILMHHSMRVPGFDIENEAEYRRILAPFVRLAREMYGGTFRPVINLVDALREKGVHVDLYIISARYGIINENDEIIPYEATLKGLKTCKIDSWSKRLGIESKLRALVENNQYDFIVVNLPREYALSIRNILGEFLQMRNAVIITALSALPKVGDAASVQAIILPGSSIPRRLRSLNLLHKALEKLFCG